MVDHQPNHMYTWTYTPTTIFSPKLTFYYPEEETTMSKTIFDDLKVLGLIDDEYEDASEFFADLHRAAELARNYGANEKILGTFEGKPQWAIVEFEDEAKTERGSTHPVFHGDEKGAKVDTEDKKNKGEY